jgi:hypothetical protein
MPDRDKEKTDKSSSRGNHKDICITLLTQSRNDAGLVAEHRVHTANGDDVEGIHGYARRSVIRNAQLQVGVPNAAGTRNEAPALLRRRAERASDRSDWQVGLGSSDRASRKLGDPALLAAGGELARSAFGKQTDTAMRGLVGLASVRQQGSGDVPKRSLVAEHGVDITHGNDKERVEFRL